MKKVNEPQLLLEWNLFCAHWGPMCKNGVQWGFIEDFDIHIYALVVSSEYSYFDLYTNTKLTSFNVQHTVTSVSKILGCFVNNKLSLLIWNLFVKLHMFSSFLYQEVINYWFSIISLYRSIKPIPFSSSVSRLYFLMNCQFIWVIVYT